MTPGFQSSFIPKGPIASPEVFQKKKAGLVGILVVSLFIGSIFLAIGAMIYKGIVKDDIANLQSELAEAEKNIDKDSIKQMVQFSKKLEIVKSIVLKHQVVSGFLSSLSSSTISTVSFSDFNYSSLTPTGLTVVMKGKTNSYTSVAVQESVFIKNKYWKSVSFSNLTLGDSGSVTFDVQVLVDPQITIYTPDVQVSRPVATSTEPLSEADDSLDDLGDLDDLDNIGSEINNL